MAAGTVTPDLTRLGPCPSVLNDPNNQLGTYAGESPWGIELGLAARLKREKRWQWFGVFNDSWALGGAIVKTGYAGKSFVWLFDRVRKELVFDCSVTVPRPVVEVAKSAAETHLGKLRGLGDQGWSIVREGSQIKVCGQLKALAFELELVETQSPFTAVCPIKDGFNITRKNVGLRAHGSFSVGGLNGKFDDAVGLVDHSHGSLERHTQWKWAIGAGRTDVGEFVGFNMIAGFNDDRENVIWHGDSLFLAAPAVFEITPQSWRVSTKDGALDLVLDVEGTRSEDLNLGLVASVYAQPLGTWSGSVLGQAVSGLVGVAEDHSAVW